MFTHTDSHGLSNADRVCTDKDVMQWPLLLSARLISRPMALCHCHLQDTVTTKNLYPSPPIPASPLPLSRFPIRTPSHLIIKAVISWQPHISKHGLEKLMANCCEKTCKSCENVAWVAKTVPEVSPEKKKKNACGPALMRQARKQNKCAA